MASYYDNLLKNRPEDQGMDQEMLVQYNNALKDREKQIAAQRDKLGSLESQGSGGGFDDVNLKPLLALSDSWFGGNLANSYQAPVNKEKHALEVERLKQGIGQQEAGLLDDRLNVARLLMEDKRARDNNIYKEEQADIDRALKRELLREKLGAQRDLSRDRNDAKIVANASKAQKYSGDTWKAAGFAKRIEQTDQIFNDLVAQGYRGPSRSEWAKSLVLPNEALSPQYRSYDQAARNFINATLRRESGSAISKGEFANAEKQYLPVPGDDDATLAQKAANRAQIRENLKAEAQGTYNQIPLMSTNGAPQAQSASPVGGKKVTVRNEKTGETLKIDVTDLPSAMRDGFKQVQ